MAQKKSKSGISRLLQFAESKKYLVSVSCVLSAVGTVLSLCPFICLWYVAKEIFAVLPNLGEVSLSSLMTYAWAAVAFAVGGFLAYYIALLCSHLAAFSIAKNIGSLIFVGVRPSL